ncbi:sulfate/molybdate ABC transporter ATP-binding protein [Nocardioides sp. Bht2]|uniref:sulfate/molybdate ABC transporter ATP-binding protein n=1 Tax=Nocardioides sp. Bht2 TaxID=3392297 RepID=UPI0039B64C04
MNLAIEIRVPERNIDVALDLPLGSTTAVLGPNGSGKSSLLAAVGGLLAPGHGTVKLGDRLLSSAAAPEVWVPPHQRRITLLAQDPRLFPHLDVLDNVAFGPRSAGQHNRAARRLAHEWLERVDAVELAHRHPDTLSGGQAQRIALARALATDPDVLLLDEPFAALDVEAAPELRRLLAELRTGVTTLLVTHDLIDAVALADQVVVLAGGRVAEYGATAEVLVRPQSAAAARAAGLNLIRDGDTLTAFRPSAVRLFDDGAPTALWTRIEALEPHGDYIRVRCTDLLADLAPVEVGALSPGDRVQWEVSPDQVTRYPAH